MYEVWKAPATGSAITLVPAGGFAASAASASVLPAATIWPPPLTLAPTRSSSASVLSTVATSPPMTADIPVGVSAQAALIAWPRTAARSTASSAGSTPASAAAASSPTECPATAAPGGSGELPGGEQCGRDHQRLGDGGVLDLVGAGGGAQRDQIQVGPVGHRRRLIADAVQFQPGSEHPRLLSSLTRSDDGQHWTSQTRSGHRRAC